MARSRSSIGFLGRFGRSQDLKQLDEALRALDVHPATVTEAVKLTAVNLLKDYAIGPEPAPQSYRAAAELLAYCVTGAEPFAQANGAGLAEAVEARIERAIGADATLDAQLILLALEARIIQPSVVQRFELESDPQ
jgi:phytoene/squalene synthetase